MFLVMLLAASFRLLTGPPAPAEQQPASFSVSGSVVNSATGDAIPEAEVTLQPQFRGVETQTVATDGSGSFAFSGLAAGRYTVTASRRGFMPQSFLQHGSYFSAVVVGEEFDTSHIVLQLPPQGVISGHILSESGEPIRDARVTVFLRDPSNPAEQSVRGAGESDDEGSYRVGRLPPGTYFVCVTAQPWYARHPPTIPPSDSPREGSLLFRGIPASLRSSDPRLDVAYQVTFFGAATQMADAEPIQIAGGETETADIMLTPVPARHIRLNMPANTMGFPSVELRSEPASIGNQIPVQSLQLEPGVWELTGIPPGHFTATLHIAEPGKQMPETRTIELGDDPAIDMDAIQGGVSIKGTIRGGAGFRPLGSHIQLSMPGLGQFRTDVAPDGTFDFSNEKFSPGKYTVVVGGTTPHYLTNLTATGAKASGRQLEVGTKDVQLSVTVSGSFSDVSGFALLDGKRTPGVLVVLAPQGGTKDTAPIRFDQSDGDGSFALHNVAAGNYVLLAVDHAWNLAWANPDFLAQFISKGQAVIAEAGGKSTFDIAVQDANSTEPKH